MMGPKRCLSLKDKEVQKKKIPETITGSKTSGAKLKETSIKKTSTAGNISTARQAPESSSVKQQVQPNYGRSSVKTKPRQENESVRNIARSTRSLSTYVSKTQVSNQVASANNVRSASNFIVSNYNKSVKKVSETAKSVSKKSVKSKLFTQYTLPPVHPVAFIKDESKIFKEKNQQKKLIDENIPEKMVSSAKELKRNENTNYSPRLSDQVTINTMSANGMDLSKQINISTPIIEVNVKDISSPSCDSRICVTSELPEKELGSPGKIQVNTKIIVTTEIESNMDSKKDTYNDIDKISNVCKCEVKDALLVSESGDHNKAKGRPSELQLHGKHECFQTLDDLNIENLEAYISLCKGQKAIMPCKDDVDRTSYVPIFDSEVSKPQISPCEPNEIKAYERGDRLKDEKPEFHDSVEKKELSSEHEYQRKELEIIQSEVKNQDEAGETDKEKCDSETLIKIQSSEFDILEINVQMAKKEIAEANRLAAIDQNDNCVEDGTENHSIITSDSDRKTFVWTPSKMANYKKSVENKSFVTLSNNSQGNSIINFMTELTDPLKEEKKDVVATQLNAIEIKENNSEMIKSTGHLKIINEAVIKGHIAEYNINCALGNRITKDLIVNLKAQERAVDDELNYNKFCNISKLEDTFDVNSLEILDLDNTCDMNEESNIADIILCGFLSEVSQLPEDRNESDSLQFSSRSSIDDFATESEVVSEKPFLSDDCVWIDYKTPIMTSHQNDYNEDDILTNWIVDGIEEAEESTDIESILLIDSDTTDWIRSAERDLEELRSSLEECDAEAQNAAQEIKIINKNNQKLTSDKYRYSKNNKYSTKKKSGSTYIRDDIGDISQLVSHITESCTGVYEPRVEHKAIVGNKSPIIEDGIGYYSVSSSDDELDVSMKQVDDEPEKSYLSFGKSCVNMRKKKDKRLSFFNLFKL